MTSDAITEFWLPVHSSLLPIYIWCSIHSIPWDLPPHECLGHPQCHSPHWQFLIFLCGQRHLCSFFTFFSTQGGCWVDQNALALLCSPKTFMTPPPLISVPFCLPCSVSNPNSRFAVCRRWNLHHTCMLGHASLHCNRTLAMECEFVRITEKMLVHVPTTKQTVKHNKQEWGSEQFCFH